MLYNSCTGIYKFGNNTYPRRIRRSSNLGHTFLGKKCVLWDGKYGNFHGMMSSMKRSIKIQLIKKFSWQWLWTAQFQRNPMPAFSSFQRQNSGLLSFFLSIVKVHVSETWIADLFPSWRYEVGRHLLHWIRQTEPFLIIQQLPQLPFHLRTETDAVPTTLCSFLKTRQGGKSTN
jgi:hypothetical protein